MADIQKPVEVPADAVEQVAAAVPEAAPAVDAPAATEEKPVEDAAAEETKAEEPAVEKAKEEVKPVEEGQLGYKAQGLSFPKNLLGSKEFFFFSSEAVEAKALEAYKKAQKSAEGALENISWAAHTGKGLLFSGDKKGPNNVINLSHASEPEVDGNKFHFTARGNKHTFKAANVAERDNWVAQIKAKIAEAKEIAASVTDSEAYKNTLESLKPAPKEEAKAAEPVAAAEETTEAPATEEAAAEEGEAAKEEPKAEEPKRRSASRKRASFFGFGKKDAAPKEETKTEETPAEVAEETIEAEATEAKAEDAPAEEAAAPTETTEEPAAEAKPANSKRNSFFGGVFSKKEKKAAEKPAETTEAAAEETEGAAETAPVIPPVDTTTPLAEEVIAAEPSETAATETKTDVKEKRKSSLNFFSKRDASPAGEPKAGAFSKFRATINRKGSAKAEEAKGEAAKAEETATEAAADAQDKVEETVADVKEEVAKAVEGEGEKTEEAAAPAVTASA